MRVQSRMRGGCGEVDEEGSCRPEWTDTSGPGQSSGTLCLWACPRAQLAPQANATSSSCLVRPLSLTLTCIGTSHAHHHLWHAPPLTHTPPRRPPPAPPLGPSPKVSATSTDRHRVAGPLPGRRGMLHRAVEFASGRSSTGVPPTHTDIFDHDVKTWNRQPSRLKASSSTSHIAHSFANTTHLLSHHAGLPVSGLDCFGG